MGHLRRLKKRLYDGKFKDRGKTFNKLLVIVTRGGKVGKAR